jgi:hypothetical protein
MGARCGSVRALRHGINPPAAASWVKTPTPEGAPMIDPRQTTAGPSTWTMIAVALTPVAGILTLLAIAAPSFA